MAISYNQCIVITMETINDRMQQIADYFCEGNKAAFAKKTGVAPTSISNYLGKQRASKPSADLLEKIVNSLEIDADWLLSGEGSMIKNEVTHTVSDDDLKEELIKLRAENDVLRELVGLKKNIGIKANVG